MWEGKLRKFSVQALVIDEVQGVDARPVREAGFQCSNYCHLSYKPAYKMPGKPLSPVEIGQIDAYRNCGKNIGEIALIMGRNRRTISRFIKKWRECNPWKTPVHKHRLGKKRLINEHASRVMARTFLKSPRKPCKQLKIEYPELFGDIKVRRLQDHACRRLQFKSRVARKMPLLTAKHIQKR